VTRTVLDVTLDNLSAAPHEVLDSVFWELDVDSPVDPRFEKEEWFSSTLLEWGPCGKLVVDGGSGPGLRSVRSRNAVPPVGELPMR
jgi:hypothetical protein